MSLYLSQTKVIKGEVNAIEDCFTDLLHLYLSEKGLGHPCQEKTTFH
jgi:hypothetical protein